MTTFSSMKQLLVLVLIFSSFLSSAQDSTFPDGKLPHFDLTVRVSLIRDRTKKMRDVRVTVTEADGTPVFEGCTDEKGEVYIDSTRILLNRIYVIRLSADGFYEDRNGSRFTTVGLHYSQNFVVDMALLTTCRMWYFAFHEPTEANRAEEHATTVRHVREMTAAYKEEYGIDVTKIGVQIHYETWDEEERLMKEAKLLLQTLKKELPEMTIDDEIQTYYHYQQQHEHTSCIQVVRLG